MTQTLQAEPLTRSEQDILKTFHTCLQLDHKTRFTSDDFRRYGLDRFLFGEVRYAVGGFFHKLLKQRLIREVGRARSVMPTNHWREIRVYEWTMMEGK